MSHAANDLPLEWATEKQLIDELGRRNIAGIVALRRDEQTMSVTRFVGDAGWVMALAGQIHKTVVLLTHNGPDVEGEHEREIG